MKKFIALLFGVVGVLFATATFAVSPLSESVQPIAKYTFVHQSFSARYVPTVGSFVRVFSYPNDGCHSEFYGTGDNPSNVMWWSNKKMLVLSVGYDCNGVPTGSIYIEAQVPAPYTNYGASWPSAYCAPW